MTQAKDNRFYDDKSSYTGVHKAGGPTVVDKEKLQLHQLLDRAPADVRGLKKVGSVIFPLALPVIPN